MLHINRCCLVAIFTPTPSPATPNRLFQNYNPPETNTLSFPALGPLSNHDTLNSRTQHFLPPVHVFFSSSSPPPLIFSPLLFSSICLRAAREIAAACVRAGGREKEKEGKRDSLFFPLPPLRACLCYMLGELRAGAHTAPHQKTTAIRSGGG